VAVADRIAAKTGMINRCRARQDGPRLVFRTTMFAMARKQVGVVQPSFGTPPANPQQQSQN
jgi:hypothetical protein